MASVAQDAGSAFPRMLGRYALYQELASGGIGSVCLARMRAEGGFSRIIAIKRLHPHHAKDSQFVTMFLDEARLAARVRHPNVVPVLDVVSAEDELFLVMEYVVGESLSKLLATACAREQRVSPPIAVSIMSGVLEGLHAAHLATNERGVPLHIVHRDVSPQNVLVGTDGIARVVDFGIAKAVGRLQESTQAGQVKGKLGYMPPEQFADAKLVDRRSDVWSASVLLWEMIAGRRLFPDAASALRYHAGTEEIAPPGILGAPDVLDTVVMKGLARAPDERFHTAREMLVAMDRAVAAAPARRVGDWVQKLARDALRRRAAWVEQIEAEAARASAALAASRSQPPPPEAPPNAMAPAASDVARAVGSSRPRGRRALGTWLAVAVLAGGLGTAAFHPTVRSAVASRHDLAPTPADAPSASARGPAVEPAPPPEEGVRSEPSASAASVAPAPSSTTKRARTLPTRAPARSTTAPAPVTTTKRTPSGDPLDLESRE